MLRRNSTKKENPAKKAAASKPAKEKKPVPVKKPRVATPQTPRPQAAGVKPRTNVYTLMLLFAFLAVLFACVLLYMDIASYGTNKKPSGVSRIVDTPFPYEIS